jgi:hypothetical protein
MNELADNVILNTDELGQVFTRPVYNMQEVMYALRRRVP